MFHLEDRLSQAWSPNYKDRIFSPNIITFALITSAYFPFYESKIVTIFLIDSSASDPLRLRLFQIPSDTSFVGKGCEHHAGGIQDFEHNA